MKVLVWGELFQLSDDELVRELQLGYESKARNFYPDGVHLVIADGLRTSLGPAVEVVTATLDDPECGLSAEVLNTVDVLVWWAHVRHQDIPDEIAERIQCRVVNDGMGFVVLHSSMESKPFQRLTGTGGSIRRWRQGEDWEAIWTVKPGHPITDGVPEVFVLSDEEMYSEYFDIPTPEELIFISSFEGGEVFRSGCCFVRGRGRIFYFRPGHESHGTYHNQHVQRVIANAVGWVNATTTSPVDLAEMGIAEREGKIGWFQDSTSAR